MAIGTKRVILAVNVVLLLITSAALTRILTKDGLGSFDFHCFWYGGNLIWQGADPYRAYIEQQKVTLPITYLDGTTVREGPIDPFDRQCVPGNTAPVVFLLSPLARFSWDTAHRIWQILNIIFSLAIGWMLLRILHLPAASSKGFLLLLLIILQLSTRETLELGQTSLLITLCMLLAMFFSYKDRAQNRTRPGSIKSGIFLGLALSKPLLSFPLLLLFLYRRRAVEVVVAAFVQIAGIYWLTRLGTGVPTVIADYFKVFIMHAGPGTQDGVYLTAGLLKGWAPYSYILIAGGSIFFAILLSKWVSQSKKDWVSQSKNGGNDIKTDLVLLTVVMLWNLLVFYHRRYDCVAASSFIALIVFLRTFSFRAGSFSLNQRLGIYGTALFAMSFWILPFYRFMDTAVYNSFFNISTLAALSLSTWLLFRIGPGRENPWLILLEDRVGAQDFEIEG